VNYENAYYKIHPGTAAAKMVAKFQRARTKALREFQAWAEAYGATSFIIHSGPKATIAAVLFDGPIPDGWRAYDRRIKGSAVPNRRHAKGRDIKLPEFTVPSGQELGHLLGFAHCDNGVLVGFKYLCSVGMMRVGGKTYIESYVFFGKDAPVHKLLHGVVQIDTAEWYAAKDKGEANAAKKAGSK
jgi:hypothetical protein